jgi:hypothetical protein
VRYGRSVKRVLAASAATLVAALAPSKAEAGPKTTLEAIRHGVEEHVLAVGCASAQVTAKLVGSTVVRAYPDEGDSVGLDAEVLDVGVSERGLVWTVGPDAETCQQNDFLTVRATGPGRPGTTSGGRSSIGAGCTRSTRRGTAG